MILSGGVQMSVEKRRQYDRAFKVEAVRLVTEEKRKLAAVARDLGIGANLLHRWKEQLSTEPDQAFPGKGHQSVEQEEVRRLRRQLADVTEERDILKKALGVFSRRPK
jgi:transposase